MRKSVPHGCPTRASSKRVLQECQVRVPEKNCQARVSYKSVGPSKKCQVRASYKSVK